MCVCVCVCAQRQQAPALYCTSPCTSLEQYIYSPLEQNRYVHCKKHDGIHHCIKSMMVYITVKSSVLK